MKNIDSIKFFSLLGLWPVIFGWLALFLAFFGLFYVSILAIAGVLSLGFLTYLATLNRKNFHLRREHLIVAALSLAAVIVFSRFSSPTVFSGRDQGSLSNAAISLAENHTLKSSFPAEKQFFSIYGEGLALNFPGFNYDASGNLVPHFPPGYISYLAAFYSFFGLFGLVLANGVAFFLFLISFYLIARNYLSYPKSITAFLLVLTSFIFSWFFKFTLSENLALALVWFGLLQFIVFLKTERPVNLLSFLATFGFLIFVRIEAVTFFAIATVILFAKYKNWKYLVRIVLGKKGLVVLGMIFLAFLISLKTSNAAYLSFAKGFLGSLNLSSADSAARIHPWELAFYVLRVFSAYALLTYLILGISALAYFLKKKKYPLLIPFFVLLPSFIYLFSPSVTLDHPWMLRRYVFAVIPVSILYTAIFLDAFLKKAHYFYLLSFFLLLTNLMIFIPYFSIQENKNLLGEIEALSSNFGKNDLILIDRESTGDPWAMMAGPMNLLYEKQAVYFFNPADLEKLDLTQFEKVYFIIPDGNLEFYRNSSFLTNLIPIKNYTLINQSLNITTGEKSKLIKIPVDLPSYQKNYIYGKIYLLK